LVLGAALTRWMFLFVHFAVGKPWEVLLADYNLLRGRTWVIVPLPELVGPPGIAAGIDMSLHVVSRLLGKEVAEKTTRQMEYPWQPAF
jgi:hypothetical protein